MRDSKGRDPKAHYDAWIAWRKWTVEHFPEMCPCKIGCEPKLEFKRTTCCVGVSCGMRIKPEYVDQHREECKVCSRPDTGPIPYLPPVGVPVVAKQK